jgi:hypothetical protein
MASAKSMPCLARFAAAFAASHSNSINGIHIHIQALKSPASAIPHHGRSAWVKFR